MSFPAHIKYIVLTLLFTAATISFSRTTINILKSSQRLDSAKKDVLALEAERDELEKDLEYKKSDDYIEEKARTELNLIREGEKIFVVPKDILSGTYEEGNNVLLNEDQSNIRMWFDLLF